MTDFVRSGLGPRTTPPSDSGATPSLYQFLRRKRFSLIDFVIITILAQVLRAVIGLV